MEGSVIRATVQDRESIVDFLNYVFSQSRCPHDFLTLQPKCYGSDAYNLGAEHYMIKENGQIRALAADRIIEYRMFDRTLKIGLIGNVSVHPYFRGKGYMKELLHTVISEARKSGVDMLCLGGQRQRYGYFGFENAGCRLNCRISAANIRHALKDVNAGDVSFEPIGTENSGYAYALYSAQPVRVKRSREEFTDVVKTWGLGCDLIRIGGRYAGYLTSYLNECVLEREEDYAKVLKAYFSAKNLPETGITADLYHRKRVDFLTGICEDYSFDHAEMASVLQWERVLETLLYCRNKVTPLGDEDFRFAIEGEKYRLRIDDGRVSVKRDDACQPEKSFSQNEATRYFFGIRSFLSGHPYLPLTFYISGADTF